MNGDATWRIRYASGGPTLRVCVAALAILLLGVVRGALPNDGQEEHVTTLRGRVLNAATNEPVPRALVVLLTNNSATFTDDHGQFELNISEKIDTDKLTPGSTIWMSRVLEARKPGFIQAHQMVTTIVYGPGATKNDQLQVTIRLVPEALVVGHVDVPGAEGEVPIQCTLYRRQTNEGRETWNPGGSFRTWADGEFRFSNLAAGTYKLITNEQMDRDSMQQGPGAQLFGYPPVYYQNTTDFSLATPIVLKAGETARVNLTVRRRKYYPVNITVANTPAGLGLFPTVYPMGHPSPGWSLGYNPGDSAIEGILPDGNYTVQASTPGQAAMSGILNFSVNGRPLEGPTLNLVPDATVTVKVREEFQAGLTNFAAQETPSDTQQPDRRRSSNVRVSLSPIDELKLFPMGSGYLQAEESQGQDLTIPNVRPGRYRVIVNAAIGYAASIQSGGKDLMHQPLVIGLGGSVAPIEVVLRDDGAEVDGTLEGDNINPATIAAEAETLRLTHLVYLRPVKEGGHLLPTQAWQGTFRFNQVPPGDYLAVAFEQSPQDPPDGIEEKIDSLSSKGQMIHLETGQKLSLKLKLVPGEGE